MAETKTVKVEKSTAKKKVAKPAEKATAKSGKKEGLLKVPQSGSSYGTGRRKSSVARVWIFPGTGTIQVNDMDVKDYICRDVLVDLVLGPLRKLNFEGKYSAKITTKGGGLTGQAGAIQMGMARALLLLDENFRKSLREDGFLTRDNRIKERKKYGKRGARKGPQYRKR